MNEPIKFCIAFSLLCHSGLAQSDFVKRVVVYKPSAMNAVSVQNVKYKTQPNGVSLSMDIYYPGDRKRDTTYPAVIFVLGYPDSTMVRMIGSKLKDIGAYTSWGRLAASAGLIGINYETQQPNVDLDDLRVFIQSNGAALGIDSKRIGMWSCSANVPTAIAALSKWRSKDVRCAALLYGMMQTPDRIYQPQIDSLSTAVGYYSRQLEPVTLIPTDIPFFIVRAGRERFKHLNATIDHFVNQATRSNSPVTMINYANGRHAFDIYDDNEESRYIIQQILTWMKSNLSSN